MNWREIITPRNLLKVFLATAVLVFVIVFSRQLLTAIFPFVVGLVLATLIEPVVNFLEKHLKLPRFLAVMATLAGTVTIVGYFLSVIVATLISELSDLYHLLPTYSKAIIDISSDLFEQLEALNDNLPAFVTTDVMGSVETFLKTIEEGARDLISRALSAVVGLPTFLVVSMIVLVSTYFISKDKDLLFSSLRKYVPERMHSKLDLAKEKISVDLVGFIKGRMVLLIIAFLISSIGLFLIGTRYWLILGLILAILDNIPVVGPGAIIFPWIALAIIVGNPYRAIYLAILYIVIFSTRQLIEPKIMGHSVGIHPLAMLLAIYGGIIFFGVLGLFIGPIILIIIKAIHSTGILKIPKGE